MRQRVAIGLVVLALAAGAGAVLGRRAREKLDGFVSEATSATAPRLASNGRELGVVWLEDGPDGSSIRFRRLDPADAIPLGAPVVVAEGAAAALPFLTADRSTGRWAVAWVDSSAEARDGAGAVWLAWLSPDGVPEGSAVRVSHAAVAGPCVRAVTDRDGIAGVTWNAAGPERGLRFARISPAGVKVGGEAQLWSSHDAIGCADLGWDGASDFGVAFPMRHEEREGGTFFGRLTRLGERRSDAAWIGPSAGLTPALAWSGATWGMVWEASGDIYFGRHEPGAPPRRLTAPVHAGGFATAPAIAYGDGRFAVVWTHVDGDSGAERLLFVELRPDGSAARPPTRLFDPNDDHGAAAVLPAGTPSGRAWTLAFERHEGGRTRVVSAHVSGEGAPRAPPVVIAP